MARRFVWILVLSLSLAVGIRATSVSAANVRVTTRPNILFIYTDDQSWRTVGCYGSRSWVKTPNIDLLAEQGVRFNYACGQAWCTPSRASVLTGRQPHGIYGYRTEEDGWGGHYDPEVCRFWPAILRESGYETAMIGKWHVTSDSGHGRDWDYSVVWDQFDRRGDWYHDQPISINGGPKKKMPEYSTDLYTRYAVNYIKSDHKKPWFMWLCYNAPHLPNTFHTRHQGRYVDNEVPNPVDIFGPRPDKPRHMRDFTMWRRTGSHKNIRHKPNNDWPFPPYPISTLPDFVRGYNRLICAVDEGAGKILKALQATDQLDTTLIIYTSDQGFAWGQHGLATKFMPYEASMRIPLIVRLPGVAAQGKVCNHPVSLVDLPPTFFALAGVELPWTMHGHDLCTILEKPEADWNHPVLAECFYRRFGTDTEELPTGNQPAMQTWWISLRQGKYKYIRTLVEKEIEELYDIETDPQELKNLAVLPAYRNLLEDYCQRMIAELKRTGAGLVKNLPAPLRM